MHHAVPEAYLPEYDFQEEQVEPEQLKPEERLVAYARDHGILYDVEFSDGEDAE